MASLHRSWPAHPRGASDRFWMLTPFTLPNACLLSLLFPISICSKLSSGAGLLLMEALQTRRGGVFPDSLKLFSWQV